jgi:hypothetical protein
MTSGELIELRLQQRRCIKCGLTAAIDWPYICDECLRALARPRIKEKTYMTVPKIDVQETLDQWLAGNAEAQKYLHKIYYVPEGANIPGPVTHMNRLTSIAHPDLELRLGVVATEETAAAANVILGLIERLDPKA